MIFQNTFIPNSFYGIKSGEDAFTRHEDFTHLNLQIFESTSSFSSSYSSTSTLLTPSLIRTSIAKTFSLSSMVLRFNLSHKRSPWMEYEKILRKIQRPSPTSNPRSPGRHPLSRVQVSSLPTAPLKQATLLLIVLLFFLGTPRHLHYDLLYLVHLLLHACPFYKGLSNTYTIYLFNSSVSKNSH